MKICSIRIKGFQQFENLHLDFTDKNGKPANKICFIGRNGTGKSTLLQIINSFILSPTNTLYNYQCFLVKLKLEGKFYYYTSYKKDSVGFNYIIGSLNINSTEQELWQELITNYQNQDTLNNSFSNKNNVIKILDKLKLSEDSTDLLIYSPAESPNNTYAQITNVPLTDLNKALPLTKNFPVYHIVSDQTIVEFWNVLIYHIKKRENNRQEFENKEENLNKTKRQLIAEFDEFNPEILDKLAKLWNKILDKAGLEFDVKNAKKPIQLNDNLYAYIKVKKTGKRINYNQLSTGIRNFIFRIGHIYSLYFNREVKRGFLLIDEPENSLFPDFLFDLMNIYQDLVIDKNRENNTQFFVATHNPIVAAQFKPHERIILEWTDQATVIAHKGKTPEGDDPNDILMNDFGLSHLMGTKGIAMWNKYKDLKKQLRRVDDSALKEELIQEINAIGEAYNFEA